MRSSSKALPPEDCAREIAPLMEPGASKERVDLADASKMRKSWRRTASSALPVRIE